jgi:hypothetical protein
MIHSLYKAGDRLERIIPLNIENSNFNYLTIDNVMYDVYNKKFLYIIEYDSRIRHSFWESHLFQNWKITYTPSISTLTNVRIERRGNFELVMVYVIIIFALLCVKVL